MQCTPRDLQAKSKKCMDECRDIDRPYNFERVLYLLVQTCFGTPPYGHHQLYPMMSKIKKNNAVMKSFKKVQEEKINVTSNLIVKEFLTAYSFLQSGSSCEHNVKISMATSSGEN